MHRNRRLPNFVFFAHGEDMHIIWFYAVFYSSCWIHIIYVPIFTRVASLALVQSCDCPSASEVTLKNIDKSTHPKAPLHTCKKAILVPIFEPYGWDVPYMQWCFYFQPLGRIVGVAPDVRNGYLFWSDISNSRSAIYRGTLNGRQPLSDVTRLTNDGSNYSIRGWGHLSEQRMIISYALCHTIDVKSS